MSRIVYDPEFGQEPSKARGDRCPACSAPLPKQRAGFQRRCENPSCSKRAKAGKLVAGSRVGRRKRFSFTYDDLAKATGRSVAALRILASRGAFDPEDFVSVVVFVEKARMKKRGGATKEP